MVKIHLGGGHDGGVGLFFVDSNMARRVEPYENCVQTVDRCWQCCRDDLGATGAALGDSYTDGDNAGTGTKYAGADPSSHDVESRESVHVRAFGGGGWYAKHGVS
jgi:hypothetical protein